MAESVLVQSHRRQALVLAAMLLPLCATAQSFIRLDKGVVTINIDWQGNVTGNDPVNVWISRKDSGSMCKKVSQAFVLVQRPPVNCSGKPDFLHPENACNRGQQWLGPTLNVWPGTFFEVIGNPFSAGTAMGVWTSNRVPTSLCNVNENDVYRYERACDANGLHCTDITYPPQPISFVPFPLKSADSQMPIIGPQDVCAQIGRPGTWSKTFPVRVEWDPICSQGAVSNFLNANGLGSGEQSCPDWFNTDNNGTADTQFQMTVNCQVPPAPTYTFTASPVSVTVGSDGKATVNGSQQSSVAYTDVACTKKLASVAVFSVQALNAPGAPPSHGAATVMVGSRTLPGDCSGQTSVIGGNPDLANEAIALCKDPANSGKTLARTQTMVAQLCGAGYCGTYGSADISKLASMNVNVSCPVTMANPVANKSLPSAGTPVPLANAPSAATVSRPAALGTPSTPTSMAPLPFPGLRWSMTLPSGPQVWTFDSADGPMAFFNDTNGYNATIVLQDDGRSLRGSYDSCGLTGTLAVNAAVLRTDAAYPDCVERLGAEIRATISGAAPVAAAAPPGGGAAMALGATPAAVSAPPAAAPSSPAGTSVYGSATVTISGGDSAVLTGQVTVMYFASLNATVLAIQTPNQSEGGGLINQFFLLEMQLAGARGVQTGSYASTDARVAQAQASVVNLGMKAVWQQSHRYPTPQSPDIGPTSILTITSPSVAAVTSANGDIVYSGVHGTFNATLPATGTATGQVTVSVNF